MAENDGNKSTAENDANKSTAPNDVNKPTAENDANKPTDDEPLQDIFADGMKLFQTVENGNEATNSDAVQKTIKAAIAKFEKATNLVSVSDMFSSNESLEELPTDTLQYLLLPVLLGTLNLKLCNQPRKELIDIAEIYFRDYLQRCKDYGVTDVEVPQPKPDSTKSENGPQSEQGKIANMVMSRDAKIKLYKEMKALKEKLSTLSKAMTAEVDDELKREYFVTLLHSYVKNALDELASIEQEKPILEYMAKHPNEPRAKERPRAPLRPVIIARDAVQKAVYGAGYPAIPTMTVEEFYENRVKEGMFPSAGTNIPHTTIQNTEENADEAEAERKEAVEEADDADELSRRRAMDEYKDDHRRGWGNRYNRS